MYIEVEIIECPYCKTKGKHAACLSRNNDYKSIEELCDTVDNCIKHYNPTDFWNCGRYDLEMVAKSSSFFELINKVELYQYREGKYIIEGIKIKSTNITLDGYSTIRLDDGREQE